MLRQLADGLVSPSDIQKECSFFFFFLAAVNEIDVVGGESVPFSVLSACVRAPFCVVQMNYRVCNRMCFFLFIFLFYYFLLFFFFLFFSFFG